MDTLLKILNTTIISTAGGTVVTVEEVILILLLLYAGYLLSRLIEYVLARRLETTKMRTDAIHLTKRVSFYLIFILITLISLHLLGLPITVFAFATGAIAIGVGFGAQNIVNNFISGWILVVDRPIRSGDFIEIDGSMGVVDLIGTRSTRIHRTDGVHMLVPNSKLLENTVTNWTLVDDVIRTSVRVGVAYGTDPRKTAALIKQAVVEHSAVLKFPEPDFIFEEFGDNALIFDAFFWCNALGEKSLRSIRSDIRFKLSELFEQNDIVIAFPQRDIHLHAKTAIPVTISPKGGNSGV